MRLFIASRIDEDTASRISSGLSSARSRLPRASWTAPHAYHLTYAFLGECEDEIATRISAALPSAIGELSRYDGVLSGGGLFPNERRPRVGWLSFENHDALVEVAVVVRQLLVDKHIAFDAKAFNPHLTVVRVRDRWRERDAAAFLDACKGIGRVDVSIGRVSLFRSELNPGGARHTEVAAGMLR